MYTPFVYIIVAERYTYSAYHTYSTYPMISVEYVCTSEHRAWDKIGDILKAVAYNPYARINFIPYGTAFSFTGAEYSKRLPKHVHEHVRYTIHRKQLMASSD